MKKIAVSIILLIAGYVACFAQGKFGYNEQIDLKIDRFDGRYAAGETVKVIAAFDPALEGPVDIQITENGKEAGRKTVPAEDGVIFEKSYDAPTLVFVQAGPKGDSKNVTTIGFIVDAEHFEPGFERPKDIDKFWKKQIRALRKVPMKAEVKEVPVPGKDGEKYECFDVNINSIDDTPCIGYVVKPKGAEPKSLPIVIYAHGAGVAKTGSRSNIRTALSYAKRGGGAIALDLNALGMKNDQPQSYYDSLDRGPLYRYSSRPIESHETFMFRTMFLRMVRALDYLTQDPSWDGERVLLYGSSQGGAQAAALAGLDPRVGAAVIVVPAMMDMGGELAGHNRAWLFTMGKQNSKEALEIAPYYDTSNLIQNFKGRLWVECGLIDKTCPAANVFSGYNKATCEKQIYTYPYRPHNEPMGRYRDGWLERIKSCRDAFIDDYLSAKK